MIHTKDRYYDGTAFYRIIPEFVAQVGRPADALAKASELGFTYDVESNDLKHLAGSLAIANAGPNTNGGELVFLAEASPRIDGSETIQEAGARFFQLILDTASGKKTKSEQFGYGDDEFAPWTIGATM